MNFICWTSFIILCAISAPAADLHLGTFDVDATPPRGSRLAYTDMVAAEQPLRCRGLVLTGAGDPIVLCTVDWLGIANEAQDLWKTALATAASTTVDRVAVHTLHQHASPRCDFTTENILREHGLTNTLFNTSHALGVIMAASNAVTKAMTKQTPITHVGVGTGRVDRVASNRRILGDDGKVTAMRWTACRNAKLRAKPVGTADDTAVTLGFFNREKAVAVLSWFACHPQSYYRNGVANPDFPGIARILREARLDDVLHIHFTGAAGDIGAGKWNDGNRRNRLVLAQRLADGIDAAWSTHTRHPITASNVAWRTTAIDLPLGKHLVESNLVASVATETNALLRLTHAKHLAWLRRSQAGHTIPLACLDLGPVAALFMPGELFVDYQLAAKQMAPDKTVALAAYGEYGCGYVCTDKAFDQGGYEPSDRATRLGPGSEPILMQAMQHLLNPNETQKPAPAASPPKPVHEAAPALTEKKSRVSPPPQPEVSEDTLPRIPPTQPGDALDTFELAPGYTLELAAHEPNVVDPIAMAFDEYGRAYVIEMRGYSERRDDALGRVRLLEDTDGDGVFDTSVIFKDGLKWPTAVTCYKGGVFVAATPDIWYFKDTDGDGRADEERHVFTGFAAGKKRLNMQALVNSLRWGPDNRIWGATAASGGLVHRPEKPATKAINLRNADFSFDPTALDIRREHGTAQYGLTFGPNNDRFACSNSKHVRWVAYEAHHLNHQKGPDWFPYPAPLVDIASDGNAAPVFRISPDEPWRIVRTRWRVAGVVRGMVEGGGRVSGYFTSASGIHYHDDRLFIGDVGSNLVHAKTLSYTNAVPTAHPWRPTPDGEFLRSRDNWFRPVSFASGPDGALYIADMYRETIEHPWSLPPGIKKHLDLTSGDDRGRIWRVTKTDAKPHPPADLANASLQQLRALVQSPNVWERDTARRLSDERGRGVVFPNTSAVLDANGKKGDNPCCRVTRLRQLNSPDAIRTAIDKRLDGNDGIGTLPELIELAGRTGDVDLIRHTAKALAEKNRADLLPDFRRGVKNWPIATTAPAWNIWRLKIAAKGLKTIKHVETIQLLGAKDDLFQSALLVRNPTNAVAIALVNAMQNPRWLAIHLPKIPEAAHPAALDRIVKHALSAQRFLHSDYDFAKLSATQQATLRDHPELRVRILASRHLPKLRTRADVLAEYQPALKRPGDTKRGNVVFARACATCHRTLDGDGIALGPDATSFANAGREVILGHILDPRREVQPAYQAYILTLTSDETLVGIIARETTKDLTLRLLGGLERTFPRNEVTSMESLGVSLMPEGLEAGISVEEMADLLTYLTTPTDTKAP